MTKPEFILKKLIKQHRLFVMLLPMVVFVIIFCYLPLLGWGMAFTDYELGKGIFDGTFTGLKQFKAFFVDASDAWYVIRNTLSINLLTVAINLTSACAFAILLNEVRISWIKRTVQSFSFFPFFISWVITYSIFNSFLSVENGVINNVMMNSGLMNKGINYLAEPRYAWGVILFVNFWKYIGYNSVIFLSTISGISQEQYEAANIDGATRIQKMLYITLPSLVPTLVILLIMNSGWIFSSNFEEFFLFTNPSNWERMEVLDVYIYRYGLKLLDFSYATAVGVVKTFASILMFFFVNQLSKQLNGRSIL